MAVDTVDQGVFNEEDKKLFVQSLFLLSVNNNLFSTPVILLSFDILVTSYS